MLEQFARKLVAEIDERLAKVLDDMSRGAYLDDPNGYAVAVGETLTLRALRDRIHEARGAFLNDEDVGA